MKKIKTGLHELTITGHPKRLFVSKIMTSRDGIKEGVELYFEGEEPFVIGIASLSCLVQKCRHNKRVRMAKRMSAPEPVKIEIPRKVPLRVSNPLTIAQRIEITQRYKRESFIKSNAKELAAEYGVGYRTISKIIRAQTKKAVLAKVGKQ